MTGSITVPDIINGTFEFLGGWMVLLHCYKLYKDKVLKGASFWATVFFSAWGYWNLYYYPHLGQWFSFAGGLGIVSANTLWVLMMIYYSQFYNPEPISYEMDCV